MTDHPNHAQASLEHATSAQRLINESQEQLLVGMKREEAFLKEVGVGTYGQAPLPNAFARAQVLATLASAHAGLANFHFGIDRATS